MAPPSSIRKALGAVKDRTSIGLAKVGGGSASISDLDVAIVKATRHDEHPAEEKHVREILGLTRYSRSHISACVATLSRRLGKTRSWAVALKCLVLVHRLLSEGDPACEEEVFFATRRGTRLLDISDFRDTSRSDPWDFSAFVRTYALYLDERLEYRMHGRRAHRPATGACRSPAPGGGSDIDQGEHDGAAAAPSSVRSTPVREMKPERAFSKAQRLQRLLERFLACRPTGAAKNSRIVALALWPLVKESHQLYFDISEALDVLIDQFMELDVPGCMKVHDFFARVAKQFDELDIFYHWCKTSGVARAADFPDIERITPEKLQVLEELIRDKSALVSGKLRHVDSPTEEAQLPAPVDGTAVEALPAPETTEETKAQTAGAAEEEHAEAIVEALESTELPEKARAVEEEEADFLNLRGDAVKPEDHGDQLALALFDGGAVAADPSAPPKWEAFAGAAAEEALDWETALVQSASTLSGQKASLGGGFDQLLLDGMYQQPAPPGGAAVGGAGSFTGSASSMALPQGQQMLALPAPPAAPGGGGEGCGGGDPFAASLVVAPPSYVQMSEMEKKQHLLVEEQRMWQQYAKDGMQGHLGAAAAAQANPYLARGCAPPCPAWA